MILPPPTARTPKGGSCLRLPSAICTTQDSIYVALISFVLACGADPRFSPLCLAVHTMKKIPHEKLKKLLELKNYFTKST